MQKESNEVKVASIKDYLEKATSEEIDTLYSHLQETGRLISHWNWEDDTSFIGVMEDDVRKYQSGDKAGVHAWNEVNEEAEKIIGSRK